jgi:hypothetical protein
MERRPSFRGIRNAENGSMNSNLSFYRTEDARDPVALGADTVAAELHACPSPVATAIRSFYRGHAASGVRATARLTASLQELAASAPAPSDFDTGFVSFDDFPPLTHWGLND